jgi:single-strand DNA-binding protein
LAVSETWRDKNGQPKEVTCLLTSSFWDKLAELCQQYLSKGRPVLVEGRLQMDEWKNQQGEKRSKLRVRADTVKFLGSPRSATMARPAEPCATTPAPQPRRRPAAEAPSLDDAGPGDLSRDDEQLPF